MSDLIHRSGGLTSNAFPEGVRLYRKTKIKETGDFKSNNI